jgi:hypothetical protein
MSLIGGSSTQPESVTRALMSTGAPQPGQLVADPVLVVLHHRQV